MTRRGVSLAEVLVALSILALGGSLATRLLFQATRELETAELGLRAALFLSELVETPGPFGEVVRPAGPGMLLAEGTPGSPGVRFEPPGGEGAVDPGHTGGYFRGRSWRLIPGVGP